MPRYVRDRVGEIILTHGAHVLPDANAAMTGVAPEYLYTVRFQATEQWGRTPTRTIRLRSICGKAILNAPEPERPFEAPWHADLFATTHALARAGAFDWAAAFGAALARAYAGGAPRDGFTYYEIWLDALEQFLAGRGLANADTLASLKDARCNAYLSTPHRQPVNLG